MLRPTPRSGPRVAPRAPRYSPALRPVSRWGTLIEAACINAGRSTRPQCILSPTMPVAGATRSPTASSSTRVRRVVLAQTLGSNRLHAARRALGCIAVGVDINATCTTVADVTAGPVTGVATPIHLGLDAAATYAIANLTRMRQQTGRAPRLTCPYPGPPLRQLGGPAEHPSCLDPAQRPPSSTSTSSVAPGKSLGDQAPAQDAVLVLAAVTGTRAETEPGQQVGLAQLRQHAGSACCLGADLRGEGGLPRRAGPS